MKSLLDNEKFGRSDFGRAWYNRTRICLVERKMDEFYRLMDLVGGPVTEGDEDFKKEAE